MRTMLFYSVGASVPEVGEDLTYESEAAPLTNWGGVRFLSIDSDSTR